MNEARKIAGWPIVAALVSLILMVVALGLYGWAYFALSFTAFYDPQVRVFQERWQAVVFTPAAKVEGYLTGEPVGLQWPLN